MGVHKDFKKIRKLKISRGVPQEKKSLKNYAISVWITQEKKVVRLKIEYNKISYTFQVSSCVIKHLLKPTLDHNIKVHQRISTKLEKSLVKNLVKILVLAMVPKNMIKIQRG